MVWAHVAVIPDGTVFEGVRRSQEVETYPAATPRLGQSIEIDICIGMPKRLDLQEKTKPSNIE